MTENIATELHNLLNNNTDIWEWEKITASLQSQIMTTFPTDKPPRYLVAPHNQQALSQILQYSHQHQYPLLLCGNGSKLDWGGFLSKNVELVVTTSKLNRIIDYAVEDLTITVESGVKLANLQSMLQENQQFLPLDGIYPETATIGGIIATADTGSWRQRYGGVRDLLLGISFVRADGAIAKAGGRVVKNVAGYDLMKLFTGSYGTLGAIAQATLRLYPLPSDSLSILVTGEDSQIQKFIQFLLASPLTPTAADLISSSLVKQLTNQSTIGLLLRFQSISISIEYQAKQVESVASQLELTSETYKNDLETNLWQRLKKMMEIKNHSQTITAKIGIIKDRAPNFLANFAQTTNHQGLAIIHLNSGNGKVIITGENLDEQILKIRSICQQNQGFLSILTGPKSLKQKIDIWGYTGNSLTIMEKLKQKFDPNYLLNPGRFLGNI